MKEKIATKVKDLKRDLILQEACRYFEEVGFENVKMSDLAKNCDISVGQLYKLFASKENIFHEYVRYQINLFYKEIQDACLHIGKPKDRLLLYLQLKFKIFKNKKKTLRDPVLGDPLFFSKLNIQNKDLTKPIFEFLRGEFESLAKEYELTQEIDYLQVAYIFNSFSMGYVEYWLNSDEELEVDEEEIMERFISGFIYK
ncbi:MAG: TetR/AcrR family transcriptional regulator [Sulfurospirillum sp.]